eukprot:c24747_g1_i2 orf=267-1391(+)
MAAPATLAAVASPFWRAPGLPYHAAAAMLRKYHKQPFEGEVAKPEERVQSTASKWRIGSPLEDDNRSMDEPDEPVIPRGHWRRWIESTKGGEEHGYQASGKEGNIPSFSGNTKGFSGSPSWNISKSEEDEFPFPSMESGDDFEARLLDKKWPKDRDGVGSNNFEHVGYENEGLLDQEGKDGYKYYYDDDDNEASAADSDYSSESDSEDNFEEQKLDKEIDELLGDPPLLDLPDPDLDGRDQEYRFRPDRSYFPGREYEPEEFDLTRPLKPPPRVRIRKAFSVQEVIDKADFRNIRFLTNFIGETGNILARRQFKMRAKSHGRVTKAIKTARFFGLMPYTNMGRRPFRFGEPYEYEATFFHDVDKGRGSSDEIKR